MGILKNKLANKYSQLPNQLIEDFRISNHAFRMAAYLYSRPDGWEVRNSVIQELFKIKDPASIAKYWKELINTGWVERERVKGADGRLAGNYDYTLNTEPTVPYVEKTPIREKPVNGKNPHLNNKELQSKKEKQKKTEPPSEVQTGLSPSSKSLNSIQHNSVFSTKTKIVATARMLISEYPKYAQLSVLIEIGSAWAWLIDNPDRKRKDQLLFLRTWLKDAVVKDKMKPAKRLQKALDRNDIYDQIETAKLVQLQSSKTASK